MPEFSGRSVLITGGAAGIGFAAAEAFSAAGARLTLASRSAERLADARQRLGGEVAVVAADVAVVDDCRKIAQAAVDAHGGIDVLFTCAGNYDTLPLESMTEELWDRTLDTHVKGTFFCVQAAADALRSARGVVVTMASDAGVLGLRGGWAAYCAAKGAIVNLTRQLAVDLAPDVRVNCIAPGPVGTEHLYADLAGATYGGFEEVADPAAALAETVPLKKIIEPAEIARAVLFAASMPSMTGAILSVDGGTTIALP